MAIKTVTLDTNNLGAVGASLALTTETTIAMYVIAKTGAHMNHRVALQVSPDNTNWYTLAIAVKDSCVVAVIAALYVRAKVEHAEGAVSTVDVTIVAL